MSKALAVQSVRTSTPLNTIGRSPARLGAFATAGCRVQQRRSYVSSTKSVNVKESTRKHAQAAEVEDVHLAAGVFDTSKGLFVKLVCRESGLMI